MSDHSGLINRRSQHDTSETARRFRDVAERAGLTVFAEIDHGRNAVEAGLTLRPTRLLVFGAGRGGTPFMQINQTAGIDLPFKALVWEDAEGATWLTYNTPQWVAERHGLGDAAAAAVAASAAGLEKLAAAATA
jgi:uncharacterized protein (DUF302 family)